MSKIIALAAALLAVGCVTSARPSSSAVAPSPLALYASAIEEAVDRYEIEVHTAAAGARSAPDEGRYEALLDASLRARGLSLDGFRALASRRPRFYFTQQALYASRLERLAELARATAPHTALAAH